jgi:elongation factor G
VLTAVTDYLPSPLERPPVAMETKADAPQTLLPPDPAGPLCALAFKVVFHPQRGPLVFLRIYSGSINVRDTVHNSTRNAKERVTRLLKVQR